MIEVVKNIELPVAGRAKKYPDLEIGDGFIVPFDGRSQYSAINNAYKFRGQRVACRRVGDELLVKRMK